MIVSDTSNISDKNDKNKPQFVHMIHYIESLGIASIGGMNFDYIISI